MKYINISDQTQYLNKYGMILAGQVFDTDEPIRNQNFLMIVEPKGEAVKYARLKGEGYFGGQEAKPIKRRKKNVNRISKAKKQC